VNVTNVSFNNFKRCIWAGKAFVFTLTIKSGSASGTYIGNKAALSPVTSLTNAPLIATSNLYGLPDPGQDFIGKIVLVQRGSPPDQPSAPIALKINNAVANGAIGVVIYNNVPGLFTSPGAPANTNIPVLLLSQTDGLAIVNSLNINPNIQGILKFDGLLEKGVNGLNVYKSTFNIENETSTIVSAIEITGSKNVNIYKDNFGHIGPTNEDPTNVFGGNAVYANGYNSDLAICKSNFSNDTGSNAIAFLVNDDWTNILVEECQMSNGIYSCQLNPSVNDPQATGSNVIIRKCNLNHSNLNFQAGILAGGINGLIEDCNITGVTPVVQIDILINSGIWLGSSQAPNNWTLSNNRISGNMESGIGITGNTSQATNNIIESCLISGSTFAGIFLLFAVSNSIARNNNISRIGTMGIYLGGVQCYNNLIETNLLNNNVDGILFYPGSTNNIAKNNNCINNTGIGIGNANIDDNLFISNTSCWNKGANYIGVPVNLIGIPGSSPVALGQNIEYSATQLSNDSNFVQTYKFPQLKLQINEALLF
jgi:parallel beta-helix repeat protein